MINERELFDLLLEPPKDKFYFQISKSKDRNLEGIPRALTILARGYLFSEEAKKLSFKKRIENCDILLKNWYCDRKEEKKKDEGRSKNEEKSFLDKADYWFENYIEAYIKAKKIKEDNAILLKKYYKEKRISFSSPLFSEKKYKGKAANDRNAISSSRIIADALWKGALRECAFVIKHNDTLSYGITNKNGTVYSYDNKNQRKKIMQCLSMVAYCLMEKCDDQQYISVQNADMACWLSIPSGTTGGKSPSGIDANIQMLQYREKPIFEKQPLGNRIKLKINPEWVNEYNPQIIDVGEVENTDYDNYDKYVNGQFGIELKEDDKK